MDFDPNQFIKDPNKRCCQLVRKITHSGVDDLNKIDLTELKNICKASGDDIMVVIHRELMKYLHKEHSQVRVGVIKLMDYLFKKSHSFRKELLDDFDSFIELTLAITQRPKVKLQLPPPKKYASLLKELTAKILHKWHSDFGEGYEKLRYAYRFLKEHQLVDFNRFRVNTQEQLIRQQKLAEQQEKILTRNIENRIREYRDLKPEISQLIAQIESLIDLLVSCENDTIQLRDEDSDQKSHRQMHGIANLSQNIDIEFSPYIEIRKNPNNDELVRNLKELKKELIENKLGRLISIEKIINKRSDQMILTLREIIDLKNRVTCLVLKLGELRIVSEEDPNNKSRDLTLNADTDDETDNDFEDVPAKDDIESYIPKSMRYEYGLEPIDHRDLESTNMKLTDESFDLNDTLPSTSGVNSSLVGACNFRLDSGKLCPRRDKVKCPFHGRIIRRDHHGTPLDDELRLEEEKRMKKTSRRPDWQDPELLTEIKAAIGVDLTMPRLDGKSNKTTFRKSLVNPKTSDQTPKQRLQRRLKSLMK